MSLIQFEERKERICMTAIYLAVESYQRGFIHIEDFFDDAKLAVETTFRFFDFGFRLICDGAAPERLRLCLEMEKMKWIKDPNSTAEDLQLIVLTEHLLHSISQGKLDLTEELCRSLIPNKNQDIFEIFEALALEIKGLNRLVEFLSHGKKINE